MRVKNIQVRNFLSFGEEEQSLEFDSINTIVGPNNSGKTNVFRALSLVGELLEDQNADTRPYHHNGDLNREFEVKIGVQFDEDEIEALSRYLICTALLANFQLKEGESSSAMENLMKTLIPQNRKRFDKLFESVSLEVLGKGLETNSFEVRLRLGKDDHELFVQRPGIITRESVKPPYLSGFGFAQALLDEARSKKPDEISNFLANKTELLPVMDYAGISLWDLFFKVIEGTYQHAIAIEGFNLNSVEFKLGNLPEFLQLRSFFRKRGNREENVSLFDVISTIYNSSLVRVSDIRNRPKAYLPVSEIGCLVQSFHS